MMSDSRCDGVTDTELDCSGVAGPSASTLIKKGRTADTLLQGLFLLYWYECLMVVLASENLHVWTACIWPLFALDWHECLLVVLACEKLHVCTVCIWRCEQAKFCREVFFMRHVWVFIHSFIQTSPITTVKTWPSKGQLKTVATSPFDFEKQEELRQHENIQAPLMENKEAYLTKLTKQKTQESDDGKTLRCKTGGQP